ncbi:hypothetical protein [uncultured Flavobacterium sp.]|uniref:hypothetical protein n=1 Tax=uncultured Flavobacterium sp. TaxID=165435 RepID=UPI0030EF825B|tara:strand:+ start:1671 stop:2279 length:609 start_codon:yes stop_codon:yes gene_type:complete
MKKIIVLISLLSIIACKKEEANSEPGIMDAIEGVQNLNKATDAMKDYEKKIEELKKLEPVSNEVYKQTLNESLGDLKRTNFSAGNTSAMGLSSGEAAYSDESGKTVKFSIFDGAGEMGSAVVQMTYLTLSMESESIQNTTTKKTETVDGIKSLTEDDTNPNNKHSSITFIHKDRFNVTLEGSQMGLDELKSYMKKIDLSKLE